MLAGSLIVGDVEISALRDVDTRMPLAEAFDGGDPPPGGLPTLGERYPEDFTSESWLFRVHCFLLRSPAGLALIDTGVGPVESTFGRWLGVAGTLPDDLDSIGVPVDDVDHVILTHVHSDHIGWNTVLTGDGFAPLFPNARYHLHEADVAWAHGYDAEGEIREFAELIAPLESSGQLDTSAGDREVLPGLGLRHAPGHTPGHRVVLLDVGGEQVLFAGDLLHYTFQLNDVMYRSPNDSDPERGSVTRGEWLDRAESEAMTLSTTHLPPGPFVRLSREGELRVARSR